MHIDFDLFQEEAKNTETAEENTLIIKICIRFSSMHLYKPSLSRSLNLYVLKEKNKRNMKMNSKPLNIIIKNSLCYVSVLRPLSQKV